ncbi:MAG: HAMP domain-containing sensor histidine kinase [Candidatus Eisenbacteria bacterium]
MASRDEFLAIVSHDVRDILAGIAMSTELLLHVPTEAPAGERMHIEAKRIRRLTARMNRLIGDLLDVVSMESGKLNMEASPEDATRLLAETMENCQAASAAREIAMTCEAPKGRVPGTFDHDRILQVLANLVGNAIKFSDVGGSIALRLAPIAEGLQFTVRDSGRGIAPEDMEAIFERFSRAGQPGRRGLGLGLYIARYIVEAHGGRIWAESELGKGSAFHFTISSLGPS